MDAPSDELETILRMVQSVAVEVNALGALMIEEPERLAHRRAMGKLNSLAAHVERVLQSAVPEPAVHR